MRHCVIVLTSLLTLSIMQFGTVAGNVHALAYEYSTSPPTVVTVEAVRVEPQHLIYWPIPAPDAEGQTCAFQFLNPIHSERVWQNLSFATLFACLPGATSMRWGMNRASVVSNMPHASACSLEGITHLGGTERVPTGVHSQRTWLAQLSSPVYPDYELPLCRRGAKLIHSGGPDPWAENSLAVRVGPEESVLAMPAWTTPSAAGRAHTERHTQAVANHAVPGGGYQTVSHGPNSPPQDAEPAPSPGSFSPGYYAMTPLPTSGLAMYYNPGIMGQVVDYRERMGEIEACDECVGYAALLRAGDLNRKIWLQWSDGRVEGPFLVVDVAARHHVDMLIRRGWAVDVDNKTAIRQGMFGPVTVTIYGAPPSLAHTPSASE
ncbi:MAG: hypothetical protein WDZ49_12435 [Litorilinea sp.]